MKTIAIRIEDNLYDKVKLMLQHFPSEKIKVFDISDKNEKMHFSKNDIKKIKNILSKHGYFIPPDLDKIPIYYDENELEQDLSVIEKLNFNDSY
ncbi:MAG: hypothetical protein K8R37_14575 [Bacteroidales bacterium]|nr:hypothetical protein [Bacteroidales bacterium]